LEVWCRLVGFDDGMMMMNDDDDDDDDFFRKIWKGI